MGKRLSRHLRRAAGKLPDRLHGDREKHLALGFTESLSKPLNRKLLEQVLSDCLRRRPGGQPAGRDHAIGGPAGLSKAVGR